MMNRIGKNLLVTGLCVTMAASGLVFASPVAAAEVISEETSGSEVDEVAESENEISEDAAQPEKAAEAGLISGEDAAEADLPVSDTESTGTEAEEQQHEEQTVEALQDGMPEPLLSAESAAGVTIVINGLSKEGAASNPVRVSDPSAAAGAEVTVTAAEVDDYYLAQIRYAYRADGKTVYQRVGEEDGVASFVMPADQVTVYADYVSIAWDGTVDLTWYDADATEYDIYFPAQFAGAAALCNGLFNDIPTREIQIGSKTVKIPDLVDEEGNPVEQDDTINRKKYHGTVASADGSGYQTFDDLDKDGIKTTVVGDLSLLDIYSVKIESGTNNLVSSEHGWYGEENFTDKTIRLQNDLDMGGVCRGLKTLYDSWSGPNYMALGGKYCINPDNPYTRLYAGFNGTLDGRGHEVYNIFFDRATGSYGDCEGCGLVGTLGVPRVELGESVKPAVKNVAVDGYFDAGRMSGGIVGSMVHTKGAKVESCINFASVFSGNGGKGQGGIVGNGTFIPSYGDRQPEVSNCVNFGYICTGYNKNAGGLVGLCELLVKDSYNVGFTAGEGSGDEEAGNILGTNNGGAVWYNCYGLTGSATAIKNNPGVTTPMVFGSTKGSAIREMDAISDLKNNSFLSVLNGKVKTGAPDANGYMDADDDVIFNTKRNWSSTDTDDFVSSQIKVSLQSVAAYHAPSTAFTDKSKEGMAKALKTVDVTGMPIPSVFISDPAELKGLKISGTPTTKYLANEKFDTGDHTRQAQSPDDPDENEFAIWAVYDDNSYAQITEYDVIYQSGGNSFAAGDTKVTVTASFEGKTLKKTFSVEVEDAQLLSLDIIKQPKNTLYAQGEYFNPDGMILRLDYGSRTGDKKNVAKRIRIEYEGYDPVVKQYVDTVQSTDNYEALSDEAAAAYVITFSPSEEKKITSSDTQVEVSHTYADRTLQQTIPITVLETVIKDQLRKDSVSTTIHISNEDEFIWFSNQIASNLDPDLRAVLEEDISVSRTEYLPVGIKGSQIIPYQGIFDGNGHRIETNLERTGAGLNGRAALFYKLGADAQVKDLTIAGSVKGSDQTGGITVLLSGGKITGCSNEAGITSTGKAAGGIVASTDTDNGTVEDCVNKGTITAAGNAGGIVGTFAKACMIKDCLNQGSVTCTDENYKSESAVGGIAGTQEAGTICRSKNAGTVYGFHNVAAGGITGKSTKENEPVIDSCYNVGEVSVKGLTAVIATTSSGTSDRGGAGGILGRALQGITITNCYNAGKVTLISDQTPSASDLPSGAITGKDAAGAAGGLIGVNRNVKNVKNNYVLKDVAGTLIGASSGGAGRSVGASNVVFTEDTALRMDEILSKLNAGNENYKEHKGFYPLLIWETPNNLFRIFGMTRYETSTGIADAMLEERGERKFDTVIVTTGNNYADALSGSYLAKVKHAPILMANPGSTAQITELAAYIKKNLATGGTVYILGGTAAVPATVEKNLSGYKTKRLSGATRYDTNLAILEEAGVRSEEILVCTGSNFADSLSASATGKPILLAGNSLSAAQKTWISSLPGNAYKIIGGPNAVNKTVEAQVRSYAKDFDRIYGEDRYQTSVEVAEAFFEDPSEAVLAIGANYPDGLCGGPLAMTRGCPLLLVKNGNNPAAESYCKNAGVNGGYVLGGAALISDLTAEAVLLSDPE